MSDIASLKKLFAEIVREAEDRPEFAARLLQIIASKKAKNPSNRRGRRAPGIFDPFQLHAQHGDEVLRARLDALDVEQLKDIVAEHGMDQARLALKWKTPDRLIDLILNTVAARSRKGDAFRS